MSSNHSSGMRRGPMGHGRGRGPAEKAKDFKGTMAKLIRYLGSYRINIIIAFLFSIVSVALMVIGPKILGNATTELTNGFMAKISGTGGIDFGNRDHPAAADRPVSHLYAVRVHPELDDGRRGAEGRLSASCGNGAQGRSSPVQLF